MPCSLVYHQYLTPRRTHIQTRRIDGEEVVAIRRTRPRDRAHKRPCVFAIHIHSSLDDGHLVSLVVDAYACVLPVERVDAVGIDGDTTHTFSCAHAYAQHTRTHT